MLLRVGSGLLVRCLQQACCRLVAGACSRALSANQEREREREKERERERKGAGGGGGKRGRGSECVREGGKEEGRVREMDGGSEGEMEGGVMQLWCPWPTSTEAQQAARAASPA
jgi:hypothetical protein